MNDDFIDTPEARRRRKCAIVNRVNDNPRGINSATLIETFSGMPPEQVSQAIADAVRDGDVMTLKYRNCGIDRILLFPNGTEFKIPLDKARLTW